VASRAGRRYSNLTNYVVGYVVGRFASQHRSVQAAVADEVTASKLLE
jgi:hypothetical protein